MNQPALVHKNNLTLKKIIAGTPWNILKHTIFLSSAMISEF